MSTLEINLIDFEKYRKLLADPNTVALPLRSFLQDMGELGQRTAIAEAPKDIGTLKGGIGLEVRPLFASVSTDLPYAPVVEFGRRAGAPPPPTTAIAGWAQRRGIPRSALFVIARAIGRRGIKGRFFMTKAKVAVEAAIPGRIDKMGKEIEGLWRR